MPAIDWGIVDMKITYGESNVSIDFCKGILILFVVLGHILLGGLSILGLACYICNKKLIKGCEIIQWFGRNSYAIYLWHVIGKICTI